jgi:putative (di)nucleoside polyphosphate hydrolase
MARPEDLPYRPCAGLCVLNAKGRVFIGRRTSGPEHIDATHVWQMPQGGIDDGEEAYPAALRELYEETNIRSVQKLGEIRGWLKYDIPRAIVGEAWGGKYRGQKQKWYALRFTGKDSEIDIANPAGGHDPEFVEWRWEPMENLPDLVVPFKRKTYERVVNAFSKFAAAAKSKPASRKRATAAKRTRAKPAKSAKSARARQAKRRPAKRAKARRSK